MGEKPHVVHLTTHLGKGGAATNVLLSAIGLVQRDYSVTVLHGAHPSEEAALIEKARRHGVEIEPIPSLQREIDFKEDRQALVEIRSRLARMKPDLLHTHQSKAGFLGRWAGRKARKSPVVHTPHGHVFYGYFPPWKTRLFTEIERRAAKWCDRLIGLTRKEIDDHLARGIGVGSQWRKIHSGVPIGEVQSLGSNALNLESELSAPANSKVYLSIGRLEPVKGFAEFLSFVAPIFEEHPNLHWAILGEGSERKRIEETIRSLQFGDRVRLLGWKENPYPWLAGAEGLWVPSRNEGMGRVLVEAFALGKPVFAAFVGSIPELIRDSDHGVLFDWDQPEAIQQSLKNFVTTPLNDNNLAEKRKRTADEYSVEKMVDALDDCYRTLLET